jgi:hypothetical protein
MPVLEKSLLKKQPFVPTITHRTKPLAGKAHDAGGVTVGEEYDGQRPIEDISK